MDKVTALLLYIIVFLFGITVGSFLNVCIWRLPRHESIVTVPSHCPACGKRLKWYELIPLFSFLALRGKCGGCKARISPQYPLIEGGNGLLWLLCLRFLGLSAECALICALGSVLLVLSVIDWRTKEIPPGLNVVILILGVINLLMNLSHWPLYVIGLFAVSLPLLLIFLVTGGGAIGGGDVKLMAAAGLLLGWKLILLALFIGCILGSVIHLSLMAAKKVGRELAMGPYLSMGIMLSALFGGGVIAWYTGFFS